MVFSVLKWLFRRSLIIFVIFWVNSLAINDFIRMLFLDERNKERDGVSAHQRYDFFRRYILWSVIYIFIAKAEHISLKYLAVLEFVPWLLLSRRVVTKYEIGLVDITILITTNVLTKRSTVCGLKTVHNCYTNVRHLYKKCGYMFKLIFVLELIINIISLWFMYELCKRIPQTTLSHFHSKNGITIRDAQPLERNVCIGYKNVVHLDGGPHVVYFKSVKMADILKTSKSYYTHSIKTMTVL